jgi:hypothetical protein
MFGLLERANLNQWKIYVGIITAPNRRKGTDSVFETLCSFAFVRIPDNGQSPETR